jgi:hypothetical protein
MCTGQVVSEAMTKQRRPADEDAGGMDEAK